MVSSNNHSSSKAAQKDKVFAGGDYGEDLVGSRIRVWWPMDKKFYKGVVDSFSSTNKKHLVLYDDGDEETLNMKKERWEYVAEEDEDDADEIALQDGSDNEGADVVPEPEKAKSNGKPSDKGKTDESVAKKKQMTGSSAKSKSKARSGKKSEDNGNVTKAEKTKDEAKQTRKTGSKPEAEKSSNFGDIGGKIVAAASRMSSRFQSKESGRDIETSEPMKSSKNRKQKRAVSSEEDVSEKAKKPRTLSKKSKSNNTDDENGVDDDSEDNDDASDDENGVDDNGENNDDASDDDESKPLLNLLNKTPEVKEALMKKLQKSKQKKEKERSSGNEAEES